MIWLIIIAVVVVCLAYPAVGLPILGGSIVLAVLIYISGAPERERQEKIEKNFAVIDNMSGQQFEYYVAQLLQKNGFTDIQLTKTSGDYGVDIIANYNGARCAVQCKRYAKKLGLKPIQEVRTGMIHYGAQVAIVATNNYFTKKAITLANETNVILWDRGDLASMIIKVEEMERKAELDKLATEEQKRNEKIHRKMKWQGRIHSLFGKLPPLEDMGTVEMPAETREFDEEEYFEMKREAEEAVKGKR